MLSPLPVTRFIKAIVLASLLGSFWIRSHAHAQEPGLLFAHYMPWYSNKDTSGKWGFHWTMNHFNPERFLWDGEREVASHDYPLMGLYDSGSPATLECHALLMKFSGIDGVIIDWYGPSNFRDYGMIHRNTAKLIPFLKKAGLKFAICYEDQSVAHMVEGGSIASNEAQNEGLKTLQALDSTWFRDPAYLTQQGRPLLFVFGPQHFRADQWKEFSEGLEHKPWIYGMPHLSKEADLDGFFAWPPVDAGKSVSSTQWMEHLQLLASRQAAGERAIGVAFPGFHDIYRQAGIRESYGSIESREGLTFTETLFHARARGTALTQIATWNDHGEGTAIEPTHGHGYRYLEILQQSPRGSAARGGRFTAADLRLPVSLYHLRLRSSGDAALLSLLDKASELLFASDCRAAEKLLDEVGARLAKQPARFAEDPYEKDPAYHLHTDIPYREIPEQTNDQMKLRCRLDVYAPADQKDVPVVVWFHGGGLTKGERSVPMGLRKQGVAVVAVNYRLSPESPSPAYLEDAAAAVAWTLNHIKQYGGSPQKVFVSGHSAGAYLACMLGLDKKWLGALNKDANSLAGLVPLSPQAITHFAIRKEQGLKELQPTVDQLAPLFHVRKDAPPMLLVTGDREKELYGRYEENAYLWRMLKLVRHPDVTLLEMQGFDHSRMPEPAMPLLLRFVREHAESRPVK